MFQPEILEICFYPPNVLHEYQDRIKNVEFFTCHMQMVVVGRCNKRRAAACSITVVLFISEINRLTKFWNSYFFLIFSKNGLKILFCMIAELHIFCLNIDNIYLNANVDKTWTNFFMNTSKHRPRSILQRKKRSDWHDTHTNIYICATQIICVMQFGLTCGKHIKHFLCLIADLKSKALPNNDMPARTKLLVENFLKKNFLGLSNISTLFTLMFFAQSSLLAAWFSQALLQISITLKSCYV